MAGKGLSNILAAFACLLCFWLCGAWAAKCALEQEGALSSPRLVAVATERIARKKQTVRVLRGDRTVELPRFTELVVAKSTGGEVNWEELVGQRVAIVRSAKQRDLWEVHVNVVWAADPLTLPENVFKVKKVLSSSAEAPIEVHVNGKPRRLKPGQLLLVLG